MQMAKFLQETIKDMAVSSKNPNKSESVQEFAKFFEKVTLFFSSLPFALLCTSFSLLPFTASFLLLIVCVLVSFVVCVCFFLFIVCL